MGLPLEYEDLFNGIYNMRYGTITHYCAFVKCCITCKTNNI